MRKIISSLVILSFLLTIVGCTQYHAQGAGAGAVLGGIAGALIDHKNPWRGGVIGAALGGVLGATITDISMRANQEAFRQNSPVAYRSDDGMKIVRADPVGEYYSDGIKKCKKIQERTWENGRLVSNNLNEVCEAEKTERAY